MKCNENVQFVSSQDHVCLTQRFLHRYFLKYCNIFSDNIKAQQLYAESEAPVFSIKSYNYWNDI